MPTIYGALGIEDTDYVFQQTTGQRSIYDLTASYVAAYRAQQAAAQAVFVDSMTSDHTQLRPARRGENLILLGCGVSAGRLRRRHCDR